MSQSAEIEDQYPAVQLQGEWFRGAHVIEALVRGDESITVRLLEAIRTDRRARKPQSTGLELLCSAFRPTVLSHLKYKFFEGDPDVADEVWNDTLLRVYCQVHRYDATKSKLKTWVFNLARYEAFSRLREDRGTPMPTSDIEGEEDRLFDYTQPLTRTEENAVRRAFARLKSNEQQLLLLRHVLGCQHAEIAAHRLGGDLPAEHVRVYVDRSTKRLARLFAEELDQPSYDEEADALRAAQVLEIKAVIRELAREGDDWLTCDEESSHVDRLGQHLTSAFRASLPDESRTTSTPLSGADAPPLEDGELPAAAEIEPFHAEDADEVVDAQFAAHEAELAIERWQRLTSARA